jgi:hypothetical protein
MAATQRILHPQWRDEYEPTTYPFGDWATLRNDAGVFIPEGAFLDASFYIVGGGSRIRLSKVIVADQVVDFYIGDDSTDELCHGQILIAEGADNVIFNDSYGRPAGIAVSTSERLLSFQTWTIGTHQFTFEQTGFVAGVSIPIPNTRFRGFILDDGSVVTGDIWLVGDDGIVLSHEEISEEDDNNCMSSTAPSQAGHYIRVDVVGDPLFLQRFCAGSPPTPRLLKTITFQRGTERLVVTPDAQGEIKLLVGRPNAESTILRIKPVNGSLRIETVGTLLQGS